MRQNYGSGFKTISKSYRKNADHVLGQSAADEKAEHTWKHVSILRRPGMHLNVIKLTLNPAMRGNTAIAC